MISSDRDFVAYTWLASYKRSPPCVAMGAHRDYDAGRRYWAGHQPVVDALIDNCSVVVAEANKDGVPVLIGFVCAEWKAGVLHYVLAHLKFPRMGIAKDLLQPFAGRENVLYSHMPTSREIPVPKGWKYDPYEALKYPLHVSKPDPVEIQPRSQRKRAVVGDAPEWGVAIESMGPEERTRLRGLLDNYETDREI